MGHDKLRKFAENENFACLVQPSASEVMPEGYLSLRDYPLKGHWTSDFFRQPGCPIVLELGCGKGEYTVALAQRNPECCHIGMDIKGARLWKGAKYATEHGMRNVGFLRSRIEFIKAFFAPSEVSEIWLTFPDPQVRKENARLTSPVFLERYRSFLKPGGRVHLKTDSRFLHEYTKAVCRANGLDVMACTEDLYGSVIPVPPVALEVKTFYESIFLQQGYKINYLAFTLNHDGALVDPSDFDAEYWRSVEGPRQLFGRDTAETRRQKLKTTNP